MAKIVALEDSIMRKGKPATAGSPILKGFISPFDATVAERLDKAGIPTIEITAAEEFGIDRITPDEPEPIMGAVRAVASGSAAYALCNDVFGKARRQAPANKVCYIRPTYGTVSRFGLIPAASSMDRSPWRATPVR